MRRQKSESVRPNRRLTAYSQAYRRRQKVTRWIGGLGCCLLLILTMFPSPVLAGEISQSELNEINNLWRSSTHALADVNCSSCHQQKTSQQFIAHPTQESCQSCHENEVETFLLGKHGIRTLEGLSPLTPAMAHLPMKESARDKQMNCNTCHNVHSVNTYPAATDSCLTCHNDTHSRNYPNSKHAHIVAEAGILPRPNQESVTCATCHLPRQQINQTTVVNHNNTYTLLPRDRMVKEVCLHCHSVEYAFNSIFDDEVVEANFARPPTLKLETFELVRQLEKKRSSKENP